MPSGEQIAGGVLAGQADAVKSAGKPMLKTASRVTRIVANRIPGLPGLVFDAASIGAAPDTRRAVIETVAGGVGALAGGALAGPLGAAGGSIAGEKAAQLYLDHEDDINAWMHGRWNDLARAAGEQVLPYTPIPRINRALGR